MTRTCKTTFLLWLALLAAGMVAAAAADRTDPTFGSGGVAEVPAPPETQGRTIGVKDLALVSGGKLAAAVGGIEGSSYFAAARLGETGDLDPTFGRAGFTERLQIRRSGFAWEGLRTQAQGLDVQPDGKIVVAGYLANSTGGTAPLLARFRPDGSLDPSFGRSGAVAPKPGPEVANPLEPFRGGGILHDVAIQPGGRIIVVGGQNEEAGGRPAAMVIAYRSDGTVDRQFGRRGRLIFRAQNRFLYNSMTTIRVLRNRKILIGGYLRGRLVLLRLTPDGRLDRGFGGGDGKVLPKGKRFDFCCQEPALLAVQRDGRIIVGSEAGRRAEYPLLLARLRPDGRPDRSFGAGGVATGKPSGRSGAYVIPTDLAVQGDNRIVVVGYQERVGEQRKVFFLFTALRYLSAGRLDRSFGNGGIQTLALGAGSTAGAAVTQGNGRVVAGGGVEGRVGVPLEPSLLLTRYLSAR
jgi:uncharacterized delta-60 repeat protein